MVGGRIRRRLAAGLTAAAVTAAAIVAGAAPAAAADQPDLRLAASAPASVVAGQQFQVTFAITNAGTADATSSQLDAEVGIGPERPWRLVNGPLGCTAASSGPPFPQAMVVCPTGPVPAGQTVTRTLTFVASEAGTFHRRAFVYPARNQQDAEPDDNDAGYSVSVAPSGGGGGGANPLQALLAAILALLGF